MNPFYFGSSVQPLFGVYHPPSEAGAQQSAVLLCPPLGQEYMRTHWRLRCLADQLAMAGFHVLRFDYFATGDSAGKSGDGTVERWHSDIRSAADEIRELSGTRQLSIVGLRAGAALAATTEGLHARNLVLWDPVISGRSYLDQLQVLHQTKLLEYNAIRRQPIKETPGEVLGFAFPEDMQASIRRIDLLSSFEVDAENVFVFATQPHSGILQLREKLQRRCRNCSVEVLDDAGDWDQASALEHAFLPHSIPAAIVNTLEGA